MGPKLHGSVSIDAAHARTCRIVICWQLWPCPACLPACMYDDRGERMHATRAVDPVATRIWAYVSPREWAGPARPHGRPARVRAVGCTRINTAVPYVLRALGLWSHARGAAMLLPKRRRGHREPLICGVLNMIPAFQRSSGWHWRVDRRARLETRATRWSMHSRLRWCHRVRVARRLDVICGRTARACRHTVV